MKIVIALVGVFLFTLALHEPPSCGAQTQASVASGPGSDETGLGLNLFHACQASIRVLDAANVSASDLHDAEFCRGYFRGFGDLNAMLGSSVCLDGASTGTSIRVYVAYMEKNPKFLDDAMIIGVIYALKDAYPCPIPRN